MGYVALYRQELLKGTVRDQIWLLLYKSHGYQLYLSIVYFTYYRYLLPLQL